MESENTTGKSIWYYLGVGGGAPADKVNNKHISIWSVVWALAVVTATWLVKSIDMSPSLKWFVALAPNLIALVVLRSYLRFLRMTDELQRRIQLEGLAVGFGAGFIFGIGYLVAEGAGAPPFKAVWMILVMTAGWIVGNVFALRRYR